MEVWRSLTEVRGFCACGDSFMLLGMLLATRLLLPVAAAPAVRILVRELVMLEDCP